MLSNAMPKLEKPIQKKLKIIQTQRTAYIDPNQPILQRKTQELIRLIPLIPLIDQLVRFHHQDISTPLRRALIKEQGLCWSKVGTLFQWWRRKPYARQTNHPQIEMEVFHSCYKFYRVLLELVDITNDIAHCEEALGQHLKLTFFKEHLEYLLKKDLDIFKKIINEFIQHSIEMGISRRIIKELMEYAISISILKKITHELTQYATKTIRAIHILRAQQPEEEIPIYLRAIEKIDIDWIEHCSIHSP